MSSITSGGNDTIIGGNNSGSGSVENGIWGDGRDMSGSSVGGDDTVVGGDNTGSGFVTNYLYGDGYILSEFAQGGDDRIISGTNAADQMWGDAGFLLDFAKGGNDMFIFRANSGHDEIFDFGQGLSGQNLGTDHIDVTSVGIHNFVELNISAYDPITQTSTVTFSPGSDVIVHSAQALTAHDFLFA